MKKLLSVVLSIVLAFSAFAVVAYAEEETEPFIYSVDAEGYATLDYCDPSVEGAVMIPAFIEIDEKIYEVKYIGENAFKGCELITTIELSEGIEQIGDMAFLNCSALTDVYIPESLVFCSYTAFNGTVGVVVHCYSTNYQFFTVFGVIQSLKIDIIDSDGDDLDLDIGMGMGSLGSVDLTNVIILAVKRIIQLVLYFIINYGEEAEPGEDVLGPEDSAEVLTVPVAIF